MARRDGTGPTGKGPLTGRGMGPCNPERPAGSPAGDFGVDNRLGYGLGLGRGRGRGRKLGRRVRR